MGVQWTVTGPRYANVYELHDALREGSNTRVLRYVVFDVLYFNGVELVNLPYSKRREIRSMICKSIAQNVQAKGNETGIEIQEVETVIVENKERLIQVYNRFLDSKYEGAIIKNPNGVYELGKRSPNWFKLKPKESLDVVITGVIPIQTGANLRVQGFRYAIKRDEDFLHMGMIRNLDAQKGGRIAELLILNGLIPQQPRLIDLSADIEHLGRFSGAHERLGFEIEPQIVVTIDYLGIVKRDERFSLRNARFLYLREDKPVDEISTYYDLYDNYSRAFRQ
ncbi:MAG: hypothetical protein IH840_02065 [Candidatus Heimdallarchaeota archaeon]|nr:hypothetical protein [Candidatus Heimdallarchaeota archaeon]